MSAETWTRAYDQTVGAVPDIATLSHRGRSRERNEDCWANESSIGLALVADGVGGQGDGSWASRRAVDLVRRFFVKAAWAGMPVSLEEQESVVLRALQFAHRVLRKANLGRPMRAASGTTIVGLWAPGGPGAMATAFNIGDSRLFRFSAAGLEKMSKDHSLHQMWLDGGKMGAEPSKRVIVQALGISSPLTPHILSFPWHSGEKVLACTDGLTGTVSQARISEILASHAGSQAGADALVAEVLAGPAPDNITVCVLSC
jgi:protein phosphatase